MTEKDWLTCASTPPMLQHLGRNGSDRKARLLGLACCLRFPELMQIPLLAEGMRIADRRLHGELLPLERKAVRRAIHEAIPEMPFPIPSPAAWCVQKLLDKKCEFSTGQILPFMVEARQQAIYIRAHESGIDPGSLPKDGAVSEEFAQCNLIRDIFGNPFRPVAADPAWITPIVVAIAAAIYDDRAFDRLPVLADALEEAGCTNADVLLHCREPGEHVRGCWVVDLVLGKA